MTAAEVDAGPEDRSRGWLPPLYPIILAMGMVLAIIMQSGGSPYAAVRVFAGFMLGAVLICVLARALLGTRDRAGVAATLVIVLVFAGPDPRIAALVLFALGIVVAERIASARFRLRVPWALAGRVLNAGSVIILVAVFMRSATDGSLGPFVGALVNEAPFLARGSSPVTPAASSPDVYLIILDGHARPDKLDSIFGYQSAFPGQLQERGFEVASGSRSNYLLTAQSLPSLLNMGHVADIVDRETAVASPFGYTSEVRRLASHSRVFDRFRDAGYDVIAVASGFEEVALRGADRFIDTGQINELELRTLGSTMVARVIQAVDPEWFADQHRSRVVSVFDATTNVARELHDRPRFVLAHVPSPHAPIVFRSDGSAEPMSDVPNFFDDTFEHRSIPRAAALSQYAGQVQHVDNLVLPVIDQILATQRPAVVLVASDHGSAAGLRWSDLERSDLDERTAILFAAYTPEQRNVFPPDISLVNVFGYLFQTYFGDAFTPQPDTAYRWKDVFLDLVPIDLPTPSSR